MLVNFAPKTVFKKIDERLKRTPQVRVKKVSGKIKKGNGEEGYKLRRWPISWVRKKNQAVQSTFFWRRKRVKFQEREMSYKLNFSIRFFEHLVRSCNNVDIKQVNSPPLPWLSRVCRHSFDAWPRQQNTFCCHETQLARTSLDANHVIMTSSTTSHFLLQ